VSLEYIGQQGDRGVTVLEMMPVMDLSNPATSGRLRRMSDIEYGRIDTQRYSPLLERSKLTGPQGADRILLAEGVTLADIQEIMAEKGYSYESYHAKRQEKKKNKSDNEYEDEAGDNLENESIEVRSDQFDAQFSENEENQEESNSLKPDTDTKEIDGSGGDDEDIEGIQVIVLRLVQEMTEVKKNYAVIKEENVALKEEIAKLKSLVAKLEQELSTGSHNKLVAKLDELFAPHAIQNGKDVH
jgi:hypothetical protein